MNAPQIPARNHVDFFNNTCSQWMKGIAILLVIACHSSTYLSHVGTWGVSLFLLISGFGLTQAYLKKGLRLFKVLFPYTMITAVWILLDMLFLQRSYSLDTVLLSLVGFDLKSSVDVTMWYITFILAWYIAFYLSFYNLSYAKITDNAGNETIINSNGVVVYTYFSLATSTPVKNPDTGDHSPVIPLALLGSGSFATALYINKRRIYRIIVKK